MVADTVEDSQLTTGRRSEGVFFAARSFIGKSVHGIGVLIATSMLTAIGFPQDARPGEVDPVVVAKLGTAYLPLLGALYLASIGFVAAYRLSRSDHEANLARLSEILNKYADTEVLVEGHTDSTGPRDHNMDLSLRRAQSVTNQLAGHNVLTSRLNMMGYGPDQPVESNTSPAGRQANRRVDLAIYANDKLKKTAEKQAQG